MAGLGARRRAAGGVSAGGLGSASAPGGLLVGVAGAPACSWLPLVPGGRRSGGRWSGLPVLRVTVLRLGGLRLAVLRLAVLRLVHRRPSVDHEV